MSSSTRREFLTQVAGATIFGFAAVSCGSDSKSSAGKKFYELSLAEWSFHKALFSKQMTNLDFSFNSSKQIRKIDRR